MSEKFWAKSESVIDHVRRPRKRLFLALILFSLCFTAFSGYGLWKISFLGLTNISANLPVILGVLFVAILAIITAGIIGIILAILGFPGSPFFLGIAWSTINMLFPLAIGLGRVFDIEKERVERSFIELSNYLVKQKGIKVKPEKLLVLTPHCIQNESCPYKITRDVSNCQACGKCQVGDLLKISNKYGVNLAVVTGGTLARKVVKSLRPEAVLAIACERDLTSGIQDIYPLPAVGILNERPEGPCCNTIVNLSHVEKTIRDLTKSDTKE